MTSERNSNGSGADFLSFASRYVARNCGQDADEPATGPEKPDTPDVFAGDDKSVGDFRQAVEEGKVISLTGPGGLMDAQQREAPQPNGANRGSLREADGSAFQVQTAPHGDVTLTGGCRPDAGGGWCLGHDRLMKDCRVELIRQMPAGPAAVLAARGAVVGYTSDRTLEHTAIGRRLTAERRADAIAGRNAEHEAAAREDKIDELMLKLDNAEALAEQLAPDLQECQRDNERLNRELAEALARIGTLAGQLTEAERKVTTLDRMVQRPVSVSSPVPQARHTCTVAMPATAYELPAGLRSATACACCKRAMPVGAGAHYDKVTLPKNRVWCIGCANR